MSSSPINKIESHPAAVWRDALGPGYAVGVVESLARVTSAAAQRPYKASR